MKDSTDNLLAFGFSGSIRPGFPVLKTGECHLSQNFLREEHHEETLATALRLPDNAAATVPALPLFEHRGDGVVHAEKRMILADYFLQPGLVLREHREILCLRNMVEAGEVEAVLATRVTFADKSDPQS